MQFSVAKSVQFSVAIDICHTRNHIAQAGPGQRDAPHLLVGSRPSAERAARYCAARIAGSDPHQNLRFCGAMGVPASHPSLGSLPANFREGCRRRSFFVAARAGAVAGYREGACADRSRIGSNRSTWRRVIDRILGKGVARTLAQITKNGGGAVTTADLGVAFSYYGAAKGRWIARDVKSGEVEHDAWGDGTGDLYINGSVYFANVPERVWMYELGGYPVLKKWLGYRHQGRIDPRPPPRARRGVRAGYRRCVHGRRAWRSTCSVAPLNSTLGAPLFLVRALGVQFQKLPQRL